MSELLELSTGILDGRLSPDETGPVNRINFQLSSISERIAVVEAFSHCIVFETDDGLLGFDTSSVQGGDRVVSAIRKWRETPFHTLIYTHGHIDHVGGCGAFMASAEAHGHQHPRLVGHENIKARFDRYQSTDGYNAVINRRQFGQFSRRGYEVGGDNQFLPSTTQAPDLTYSSQMTLDIGGLSVELNHAKGETDDHTWGWIPAHRAICAGDFFIWCFPNAGNPQKVQRYPAEWARAMRAMAK
ncbi:MAG: MBL fold metallo-hydrolase, partial [Pseudomonadales bacterium]